MKRKDLSQIIPLYATDSMIRKAKNDKGTVNSWGRMEYETNLYLQAKHEKEYLVVYMYFRESLSKGKRTPDFAIFFSQLEMDHITWNEHTKTWNTGRIDSLDNGYHHCWYSKETTVCSKTDEKIISKYFKDKDGSVLRKIRSFQEDVRQARMFRRDSQIIKKTDEVMKLVPKLPTGIKEWSIKNGFEELLMYKGKSEWKDAYCTHCGRYVRLFKPKHNSSRNCPSCNTKCTTKAFGLQNTITQVSHTILIQKYSDNKYVIRQFSIRRRLRKETNWTINHDVRFEETCREILTDRFVVLDWYTFGKWRTTDVRRWCPKEADNYGYYYNPLCRGIIYTKNIKQNLKEYDFTKGNFKKYMYTGPGKVTDSIFILQRLLRYPYIEYIEKMGLTKLANEMMTATEAEGIFNKDAVDVKNALQLTGQQVQRLREVNGNSLVLRYLQKEGKEYLKPELLKYVMIHRLPYQDLHVERTHLSITKAVNLIKRVVKESRQDLRRILGTYEDYLNMAEERGEDITDEIICKNARFIEFHDRYLEEKNAQKNKERDDYVNKKFRNIRKNFKENKKHFAYKSGKYQIIVPDKASDITKEGRLQHHCVGASDMYMKKMNEKKTFIIFMRNIATPDLPYYTLEVEWGGKIIQWYSEHDRKPNKEEVKKWLDKFTANIKKRTAKEKTA